MRKTINISLKELLHAINILGDDRDVTVDGIDSIANTLSLPDSLITLLTSISPSS